MLIKTPNSFGKAIFQINSQSLKKQCGGVKKRTTSEIKI